MHRDVPHVNKGQTNIGRFAKVARNRACVRNPVYLRIGFVLCELIGRREASKSEASIAAVDPREREFRVPLKVYRYKDRVI